LETLFPECRVARVLLDRSLDRPLDYLVPGTLEGKIGVGSRVRVPLQNRMLLGTVVGLPEEAETAKLKEIADVLGDRPMLSPVLLELARWMAGYYLCREETAMRTILPQVIRAAKLGHRQRKGAKLSRPVSDEDLDRIGKRAPRQAAVLAALRESPGETVAVTALEAELGGVSGAVDALHKAGWVEFEDIQQQRDPHADDIFLPNDILQLNAAQKHCLDAVVGSLDIPTEHKPFLLHGVTGSGKTEVYLQAVQAALDRGKSALVLVPEISLAPQTVERFKSRFSAMQDEVAVLHSHLSDGERHDEWFKIHSGKARVVIGARSAVFAPLPNLGIIIVDEEHESSYKQEEMPKYHARDVAVMRARLEPCVILLGTATPSTESFHNTTTGKYALLELPERVDNQTLPIIRILDLRTQRRKPGSDGLLSVPLQQAIASRLQKNEQIILFLNRRGYSTSLICEACGHVCTCPDCSVALTYHRDSERLVCHICGGTRRAPKSCPECSDPGIRFSGVGTQKIEEAVKRFFPKARVLRMDADSMSRKDAYREAFLAFKKGNIDILIGTQMIAKGLHFPNVTLVGIINADMGLHLPDFRAGERTFQLLTQVAGRAGRGELEGEVMVQTSTPAHPAIQFARHHDYTGFWEQEREFREQFHYPPFVRMILITVRSEAEAMAEFTAQTLYRRLSEDLPGDVFLGSVAPAPLTKAKGQFRYQVAMRGPKNAALGRHVRMVLDRLTLPEDVFISVDVDPYSLL
jgi:primosomal protein N' (replication factor Y) (superfamily II helicase)